MPKTADKRAEARRLARLQRAHQLSPERAVVRRVPSARRRAQPSGPLAAIKNYPWATTLFVVALVGLAAVFASSQHLGPWAPPKPKSSPAATQATCDLSKHTCNKAPIMTIDTAKSYTATIHTAKGDIAIALDAKDAPIATNNFVFLANQRFYNGLDFWRIEKPGQPSPLNNQPSNLALIQGGAPQPNGQGNAGYSIKDDPVVGAYSAGVVAMAKTTSPNSGSTQFFINTGDNSTALAGNKVFTIFGHVVSGLDVAKQIQAGDKMLTVTIAVK